MATEAEIRDAERTRLEAIVAEHGTDGERASLLFSGVLRSGVSLKQLAAAREAGESIGRLPPDPETLVQLSRRAERRVRLKLPQAECAADPPRRYCDCLELALDKPGEDGKRAVLKLAAAFHKRTQWTLTSPPATPGSQDAPPAPDEANQTVEDAFPRPEPRPKSEPPVRVIHRTPKWYDDKPSFSDMKF